MLHRHWKRLEQVSRVVRNQHIQTPFIFLQDGETDDDVPDKIERWMAGETVEGISGEYKGGEVRIIQPFSFVSPGEV